MVGKDRKSKTAKNLLEGKNCSNCKYHQFYYGGDEFCEIDMIESITRSYPDIETTRNGQIDVTGSESCERWEDGRMYGS